MCPERFVTHVSGRSRRFDPEPHADPRILSFVPGHVSYSRFRPAAECPPLSLAPDPVSLDLEKTACSRVVGEIG
jgi:hypothetical protein